MNFKSILALFGVMLFGAGLVMAISGATPTLVSDSRWSGAAAANDTTEGGNISAVNIAGVSLTDRWAAYYGNVSGTINLTDGTNSIYSWTPSTYTGEVCLATGSAYNYNAAVAATTAGINTAWSFSTGTDTATNTFNDGTCSDLVFSQATVTSPIQADHESGTFFTCAIRDGVGTAKANFAFCTPIQNAGTAFNGITSQYEVIVPTSDASASATENYYFYIELN